MAIYGTALLSVCLLAGLVLGKLLGILVGLAATDPKLVPYGAMTATFYTGLGCLLGPSLVYMVIRTIM